MTKPKIERCEYDNEPWPCQTVRELDYSRVIARVGELLREHADEEYGINPVGLAAVRKAVFLANDGHPEYQKCNRPAAVRRRPMLDLDAIQAALTEPCIALRLVQTDHGGCLDFDVEDLRALVAELRAAREVVGAAQANADTWDEHYHQRPVDRNLVSALAAYRAVVGTSR